MFAAAAAAPAALLATAAAPPATIDAAEVTAPSTLFARIAFTSEIAPCASRANTAVAGTKLSTVSATGTAFFRTLPSFEKNPGFLHELERRVPPDPTASFSVYEPTLICCSPGGPLSAERTCCSVFATSASESFCRA